MTNSLPSLTLDSKTNLLNILNKYTHKNIIFQLHLFFLFIGWSIVVYLLFFDVIFNNIDIEIILF
jgi:hypothetical protein